MEWIIIAVVVVLVLIVIGIYNRLVGLRQNVNQGVADIDAQLRQRHDLIPNLVNAVKGYATHERETLDQVIEARNRAAASTNSANEAQLRVALDKLLALGEAYPDLKASANFQQLQTDLADIEDKLAAARRFFNNGVGEYNAAIQHFPAVIFAGLMGFQQQVFFDVGQDQRQALEAPPKVAF